MKNKKIVIIIIILVSLIALFTFIGINFYRGYQEDKRKTAEIITKIEETYILFTTNINDFNAKRDVLHNQIFVDNYYDGMETKIEGWTKLLNEYDVIVEKIDKDSTYLKDNCEKVRLLNNPVSYQCESFSFTYETAVNSYVSDIALYNESIKGYNEWLNSNNEANELKPLEIYNGKLYNEYIDYNNDGEFFGKN